LADGRGGRDHVAAIHEESSTIQPISAPRVGRVSIAAPARSALLAGCLPAALLIGALVWPLVFTDEIFSPDWAEQLWFVSHQALAIEANHAPSLFLHSAGGVFYPIYAFYGGTLYALTGIVAIALGQAPIPAYVIAYVLAFTASYGGWYWLARMSGLGRWSAHAPGAVFVTSAYYLTLIYSRGDWPEFMGVSTIPLLIASGLSVLRAERLRVWPALALVLSGIVFFGSHNVTIVWGSTSILLCGLAMLLTIPQARRAVTCRGAIRLLALLALTVLVNAWFLLPTAVYESSTRIASEYPYWRELLRASLSLVAPANLFTLSRASVSTPGTAFAVALPILAIAWVVVGLPVLLRSRLRDPWARVLLICAIFTVVVGLFMTHAGLLLALPRVYSTLQFSYRLDTYVLLGVSGAVLASLVLARRGGRGRRLWSWLLVPVLGVSIVGAIQQVDAYPAGGETRGQVLVSEAAPPHGVPPGVVPPAAPRPDYTDAALPRMAAPPDTRPGEVFFPPSAIHDDRVSVLVHLHPGQLVYSNLQAPPYLVHVSGARIVGIDPGAYDVLEISPRPGATASAEKGRRSTASSTERVSVSPAGSLPVVLGRWISAFAALALAVGFALLILRRRRAPPG